MEIDSCTYCDEKKEEKNVNECTPCGICKNFSHGVENGRLWMTRNKYRTRNYESVTPVTRPPKSILVCDDCIKNPK